MNDKYIIALQEEIIRVSDYCVRLWKQIDASHDDIHRKDLIHNYDNSLSYIEALNFCLDLLKNERTCKNVEET